MIVLTKDHLDHVVKEYLKHDEFVFDIETTGEHRGDPRRNRIVWISLATKGTACAIPMGHPIGEVLEPEKVLRATKKREASMIPAVTTAPPTQLWPGQVFEALEPLFFSDRRKIGHGVKFDLESTSKYYDSPIPKPYGDTLIAAWLLNENYQGKYKLGMTVEREFGFVYDKSTGKAIEKAPFKLAARYALLDSKYTWLLWRKYLPLLEKQGLLDLFNLEMGVLRVLVDMETEGVPIDRAAMTTLDASLKEKIQEIEETIYSAAGKVINLDSPKQKAEFVYKTRGHKPKVFTAKPDAEGNPNPSTSAEALESYRKDPVVAAMLDYSEVGSLHKTFTQGLLSLLVNDRLHADFVQYGTVTGRFSCRDPNLQNIPRPDEDKPDYNIRSLFVAPENHSLVVADYSQIEYRLLAHYCQDPRIINAYKKDVNTDFHALTAAILWNKPLEEVTKKERQTAKNVNFAIVYGAGPHKVASMSDITVSRARAVLEKHQEMFPKVYVFNDSVVRAARKRKPPHVKTVMKRCRRIPTVMSSDWKLRGRAERQMVNAVIQGSAADVIKLAMVKVHDSLPPEMKLIMTVHDELILICPDDVVDLGKKILSKGMESIGDDLGLTVPLVAEAESGKRWSEAKK